MAVAYPNVPIWLVSAAWNSVTLGAATGAVKGCRIEHGGEAVPLRAADDLYPRARPIVNRDAKIVVSIAWHTAATVAGWIGTKSDMVLTMKYQDGSTTGTVTLADMVCEAWSGGINSSREPTLDLTFGHASDDGSTNPVT